VNGPSAPAAQGPVSVVVATRNRPQRLRACLAAITTTLRDGDELLVVDSASTTRETLAVAEAAGARILRLEAPGASRARNAGWKAARHRRIAFTDDDCLPQRGWLDALAGHPHADFVTGRVEAPAPVDRPVAVKTDAEPAALDASTHEPLGASNNLLVGRELLECTGGFDERLGPGTWPESAEDLALFDRLLHAGGRGQYEPAALVLHEQWRARRELVRLDWGYGKGQGARLALLRGLDRRRARDRRRRLLWDVGAASAARDLRAGYEFGALTTAVRTVGTAVGYGYGRVALRSLWMGEET
jgi:glycosyltransferase involved in cell wall biosynthesis